MRVLALFLAAVSLSTLIQDALCATPDDIKGVFSLWKATAKARNLCPQVIRHTAYASTGANGGYIRIYHNTTEVSRGVKCTSKSKFQYTVLLDSATLKKEVENNPALFPLSSNADLGLLDLLLRTGAIVGTEAFGDRLCGRYSFRKGTIVAFLRNSTVSVPELGLSGLVDGDKYLLMFETGKPVTNLKRCVYRSAAVVAKPKAKRPDCFPASARVSLHDGSTVRMDALNHGSEARIASNRQSSSVFAFSHKDDAVSGDYMRFTTESGALLVVSPGHYLFSEGVMKLASAVREGDLLDMETSSVRVTKIEESVMEIGRFNPHTHAGELLVNGFRVSCYTSAVHPHLAHQLLAPIRLLWKMTGGWRDSNPALGWLHADSSIHSLSSWLPSGPSQVRW